MKDYGLTSDCVNCNQPFHYPVWIEKQVGGPNGGPKSCRKCGFKSCLKCGHKIGGCKCGPII